MAKAKKPTTAEKAWGFAKGHLGGIKDAGLDHAKEAWADIGNVYQNVLWGHSGVGAPNQPQPQLGPLAVQSLSMSVEIDMQFGPGQKHPEVSIKQGAHVHETRFTLPPAGPAQDGSKAGEVGPPSSEADGPDEKINKVGPPKSQLSPGVKPHYKDQEIAEPDIDM
jgi:hypothetical protein